MSLQLRPVTLAEVRRFVADHHRHNEPPMTWKFGVGVALAEELVGVACAGLPKGRMLMDTYTAEVNRTCTDGARNANSMLYGAIARAAKALGYRRLYTYTLATESGASLKAAGWVVDAEIPTTGRTWEGAHPRCGVPQRDLFGNERHPVEAKLRWRRDL